MDPEVMRRRLLLLADRLPQALSSMDKRKVPWVLKGMLGAIPLAAPLLQGWVEEASPEMLRSSMTSLEALLTAIGSSELTDEQFMAGALGLLNGNSDKAVNAKTTA